MKILVVDDIGYIRYTVEKALTRNGYEVCIAADAEKALNELQNSDFDLVLTDLRMPQVDGVEFINRAAGLKRRMIDGSYKPIPLPPFVLLTAVVDVEQITLARSAGFAAILNKPFDLQKLNDTINSVCPHKAL